MGTVDSILTRRTAYITVEPIVARVAETFSRSKMACPIDAVNAFIGAIISISSIWTFNFTSVTHPARVAVDAFAIDAITEMTIFAKWASFMAIFTKESISTDLITSGAVPASFTGDAAPLSHLTGLLAFTVTTSVSAVLTIEASWTGLPAELPSESWPACAGSVRGVTAPVDTLARLLTVCAPEPLSTHTTASELLARRSIAGTLGIAVTAIPSSVAMTLA